MLPNGLPLWAQYALDALYPYGLQWLAVFAVAAPIALWAKRVWWVANATALAGVPAALAARLQQQNQQPPAWLAPGSWGARGVVYAAVAGRACLLAAAWQLLQHSQALSVARAAGAAALVLASAAPAALAMLPVAGATAGTEPQPLPAGCAPRSTLLALSAGLELVLLLAAACGPALALPVALSAAACLRLLQQHAVLPLLAYSVVREGDAVEVELTAKLDTGVQFDATEPGQSLPLLAGAAAQEAQRALEAALEPALAEVAQQHEQQWQQHAEVWQRRAEEWRQQHPEGRGQEAQGGGEEAAEEGPGLAELHQQQQQAAYALQAQQDEEIRQLVARLSPDMSGLLPAAALDAPHARWRPFLEALQVCGVWW